MRKVAILEYDITKKDNKGRFTKVEIAQGYFHQWGCDFEECDTGCGNYSTAIVEKDNGEVVNVPADMIKFLEQ